MIRLEKRPQPSQLWTLLTPVLACLLYTSDAADE